MLRRRARADGQTMEAYMRQQVVDLAAVPTKGEHLAVISRALGRPGAVVPTTEQIVADVAAERR